MAIIDYYSKKTGITYVYDSQSYWDKELKQPRSKRVLIGKRDPLTGELIPTGRKGRPVVVSPVDENIDYVRLYEECKRKLQEAETANIRLRRELSILRQAIRRQSNSIGQAVEKLRSLIDNTPAEED